MRQADLFDPDPSAEPAPVVVGADPSKVRAELQAMLSTLRAASVLPWTVEDLRYRRTVFPQMSRWLPEEEAAQLCFAFDRELERLLAA